MPKTKRTPTKDKTGIKSTPVVTPVAAYRQLADKGPVQSTLTQLFRMEHNDESPSEKESSINSAFEPKKKRSVQKEVNTSPPKQVSTTKTKRFSSKDAAYNGDKTKAQPGDIIMSTVEKIQHPLFEQGIVKKILCCLASFARSLTMTGIRGIPQDTPAITSASRCAGVT